MVLAAVFFRRSLLLAHPFELPQGDRVQILVLHVHFALLLAQGRGEFVFVCALLVWVAQFGLLAGFLEEFVAGDFIASQSHAKGWPHFAKWYGLHLNSRFSHCITLEVPKFNRL